MQRTTYYDDRQLKTGRVKYFYSHLREIDKFGSIDNNPFFLIAGIYGLTRHKWSSSEE